MKVIETKIPGVLIVETDVFGDHRGYFTETYSKPKYEKLGITVDFAVDIRKGSPTFGEWVSVELSAENHRQFFIPQGFAHGFLTLTDDVEFRYKVDNVYNKESEGGMRYDDPTANVDWGSLLNGIEPVLSEKDQTGPTLENSNNQFVYEGDK